MWPSLSLVSEPSNASVGGEREARVVGEAVQRGVRDRRARDLDVTAGLVGDGRAVPGQPERGRLRYALVVAIDGAVAHVGDDGPVGAELCALARADELV